MEAWPAERPKTKEEPGQLTVERIRGQTPPWQTLFWELVVAVGRGPGTLDPGALETVDGKSVGLGVA